MGAFKKLEGRTLWVDMSQIHVPSWKIREVQKSAHAKLRALKRVDPFAKVVGCKKVYETAEELKAACDSYFNSREFILRDKWGQPITDPETGEVLKDTKPLTLSGLALHIGVSTPTLWRYRKTAAAGLCRPDYAQVVQEAVQRIESYAEERIYDKDGQRGSQFVLQVGFGWNTRKEKRESKRLQVETEIAKAKLKMQQEEHRMKMKMLEAGLDSGSVDNEVKITITRASRKDEE